MQNIDLQSGTKRVKAAMAAKRMEFDAFVEHAAGLDARDFFSPTLGNDSIFEICCFLHFRLGHHKTPSDYETTDRMCAWIIDRCVEQGKPELLRRRIYSSSQSIMDRMLGMCCCSALTRLIAAGVEPTQLQIANLLGYQLDWPEQHALKNERIDTAHVVIRSSMNAEMARQTLREIAHEAAQEPGMRAA